MNKLKNVKRTKKTLILITLAACLCLSVVFATLLNGSLFNASADATDGGRVTMLDLMGRYPVDYVVGPIDVKSETINARGQYEYKTTNFEMDALGRPVVHSCDNPSSCGHQVAVYNGELQEYKGKTCILTNNTYGIPANQYFNVETYIYTEDDSQNEGGRVLYGWNPDIQAVAMSGNNAKKIAENGKIMSGETVTEVTGIFAHFNSGDIFGSTGKYVLIVPSDITRVGKGNAAYVYNGKSYYQDVLSGTADGAKYTDFSSFIYSGSLSHYEGEPYFWQPRERLLGIYFTDDSNLTAIDGATYSGTPENMWGSNTRTASGRKTKAAFEACDNTRFVILPYGLTSIGKSAFYKCTNIVDINIPTSVESIDAYAFQNCTSVRALPRPTSGVNSDAFKNCSFEDESTIYIMGGAPTVDENGNKVYDNGTNGFIFKKNGNSWEAKSLAGATGEGEGDTSPIFIFPDSSDFRSDSDRRVGVAYDYIGRDGTKNKNQFPEGGVTSYKIADNFAAGKWCQNIILPKAVTEIGASAFAQSHVKYLETYATKIGANAFTGAENKEGDKQWYYFHWTGTETTANYSIPNGAFVTPNGTRYIVFESKAMMDTVGSAFTGLTNLAPNGSSEIHYQIPVYAHVYSEDVETVDGKGISLAQSDMTDRFFNDSDYNDYVNNSVLKQGDNVILYTKRLSGYSFDQTKLARGGWSTSGGSVHSNPTLDYMNSTVWYTLANGADTSASASYQTATTAGAQYDSATSTRVDIYTKKIAAPEKLADKTYEFGKAYAGKGTLTDAPAATDPNQTAGSFTFASSLDLRVDYVSSIDSFIYPNGNSIAPAATYVFNVRHAGTYSLVIGLDAKWGAWKDDYQTINRQATVTVERQKFDLSSLDKIPEFVTSDNVSLRGNNTTLYRYNDGYFLTQQNGEEPISTVVVTNGYVYATGRNISLGLTGYNGNDEKSDYGYLMSTNTFDAKGSNEYYTTYTFAVKYIEGAPGQTDYEFYYGAADDDTRFNDLYDDALGLRLDRKTAAGARVSKRWYIVTETNFFVDSTEESITENTAPYAPVYKDGKPVYSWAYEDELMVKTPKLAYNLTGENAKNPMVEIVYIPVGGKAITIKEKGLITETGALGYYINSAMPVGEYTVTVYGDEVDVPDGEESKHYLEIVNTYTLTVNPRTMDSVAVNALHDAIKGGTKGNAFPLDGKELHGDITSNKTSLEETLNVKYAAANTNNYWKTLADGTLTYGNGDTLKLYDSSVTITYNREGSGNLIYFSYDEMLGSLALAGANEYKFYFSISAKNYETVGGASASDRQDYDFNTVWYTDMKIADIYKILLGKVVSPYFKDVTYTGSAVYTSVEPSQYYNYEFNDSDYVNAGRVFVTLKLYDAKLAAWNTTLSSTDFTESEIANASNYFTLSSDGESIKVYYNINSAINSWSVVPQMASWSFNGFDKTVNFVTAGLTFDGADIEYALSSDLSTWTTFTVDGNGMVSDATAELLNKLKPGAYYLRSTIGSITGVNDKGATVTNVNGFEFAAQNTSGQYLTSITVSKAVNSWTETPNVMTWIWGSYDSERNTISATAAYPALKPTYVNSNGDKVVDTTFVYTNGGTALPVITFSIRKAGETAPIAGLESFTEVDETIAAILKTLHAGKYELTTSVGGSDYYTAISETTLTFAIAQAVNSWTTTPQITQWTWGQFDENVNVILAAAQFNGGDGSEGSQDNAIKFTILKQVDSVLRIMQRVPVSAILTDFTLVNGVLDEDVIKELDALPAGLYYLRASKDGNSDYAAIAGTENTDIPFTVAQAENAWLVTPGMTSWQYKSYANDFVAGKSTYGNIYDVVYTVTGNGKTVNLEYTYDAEKDEIHLKDSSVEALNALAVGNYLLTAHLDGTNDYKPADYSAQFTVSKTNNSWTKAPILTGWTYGQFTSGNFTAGVPALNEEGKTVVYSLAIDGGEAVDIEFKFNADGSLSSDTVSALKGLLANDYTLTVTLDASDTANYYPLTRDITFRITIANNSWETTPGMTGWQYKGFVSNVNFIAGVPVGKSDSADVKVTYALFDTTPTLAAFKALTSGKFTGIAEVADDLNAKTCGNYYIAAYYPVVDGKYDELFAFVSFAVSKATTNVWTAHANVSGWTYGQTAWQVTAGTATFGSDNASYTLAKQGKNGYVDVASAVDVLLGNLNNSLQSLGAGSYRLTVKIEGTDNYVGTTDTLYFTVAKANNDWTTAPSMGDYDWVYGETAGTVTMGEVAYTDGVNEDGENNITVAMAFYAARQIKGVWTVDYATSYDSMPTDIGHYALVVTANGTDNYNELKEELFFNITMFANSWTTNPENSLIWTWGDTSAMENSVLVKATAVKADVVTYTINYASNGNAYKSNITKDNIIAELKVLPVGNYVITVTSAEDVANSNYSSVSSSCDITVNPATLVWSVTPVGAAWTWGDADENRTFTTPEATAVKDGDIVSYKFVVSKQNAEGKFVVEGTYNSYSELTSVILAEDYAAGNYKIVVSATCANHDDLDQEVTLTIAARDFTWVSDPVNASWAWGDRQAEADKIVKPQVTDNDDVQVDLTYELSYGKETFDGADAFASLVARLKQDDVDASRTYTVTVTAKRDNYVTSVKTFTVTVSQSTNVWTVMPTTTIEKEFESDIAAEKLVIGVAKHGDVIYSIGGEAVDKTTLLDTINGLGVGEFKYVITVLGTENKYTGFSTTLTVVVKGKGSTWNQDFATEYTFDFSTHSQLQKDMQTVVIPTKEAGSLNGTVTYDIKYKNHDGGDLYSTAISLAELRNYLEGSDRNAGTYEIGVHYTPAVDGYSPLNTVITVTVNRQHVTLDNLEAYEQSNWEYEDSFEDITVPEPKLNVTRPITYIITKSNSSDPISMGDYTKLVERLNALSVGQYTIKFYIDADVNHTGIASASEPLTIRLRINPAVNSWREGTTFDNITMTRGDEFNIVVPQALRGATRVVYGVTPLDLTGTTLNDYLNNLVKNKPDDQMVQAGSHRIEFIVDGTSDYNGVSGFYTITINKKVNSWKENTVPQEEYPFSGTVNAEAFTLPEPEEKSEILFFSYTKSGTTEVKGGLSVRQFRTELAGFKNGTYRVTARVGGSAPDGLDSSLATVLTKYNSDYETLEISFTIVVTRSDNNWTTPLENANWTYGFAPSAITKPVAEHGNEISYSIVGIQLNNVNVNSTYNEFSDFQDAVKALNAGSYTITATIGDENDTYVGTSCSATVMVGQYATQWNYSGQSVYSWIYNDSNNPEIPWITANPNAVAVKYSVISNGNTVDMPNDDPNTAENESNYNTYLKTQNIGTYIIQATVVDKDADSKVVGLNYAAITMQITVTISAADNAWKYGKAPVNLEFVYGNAPASVEYEAQNNNSALQLSIDGEEVSVSGLAAKMKGLNAGTHTLIATVPEQGNYKALTSTVTITVSQQTEVWSDSSLGVGVIDNNAHTNKWTWNTSYGQGNWGNPVLPVPTYSNTATVTITSDDVTFNTIRITLIYEKNADGRMVVREADMQLLVSRMKSLNAGGYVITVTVEDTANYKGITKSQAFAVAKADNSWNDDPAVENWNYNGTIMYPTAVPQFGNANDVVFYYAAYAESHGVNLEHLENHTEFLATLTWTTDRPTEKGTYYLKGELAGTTNYSDLVGYNYFTIGADSNEWIDAASVIAWNWNNYDRTKNLFGGSAHAGNAKFTIRKMVNGEPVALTVDDFIVWNDITRTFSKITDGEFNLIKNGFARELDANNKQTKFVSQGIANVLKWLLPGSYQLTVVISGDPNYETRTATVTFSIGKAANGWTKVPGIVSYTYGEYGATTLTTGEATYGNVLYSITGSNGFEVGASGYSLTAIAGELATLNAGNYTLNIWVNEDANYDTYATVAARSVQFEVLKATNAWTNNTGRDSQISKDWTDIQALTDLNALYPAYGATDGTLKYSILNEDYSYSVYKQAGQLDKELSGLSYADLLTYLKKLSLGQYYIRATVDPTTNYTGLSPLDTALVITSRTNSFNADNDEHFTAQWKQIRDEQGNLVNASELQKIKFGAEYGGNTITYTLQNVTLPVEYRGRLNEVNFALAVKTLNAGSYNVLVEIDETNDYAGLSAVVMLVVGAGTNSWQNDWAIGTSFIVSESATLEWTWGSKVDWLNAQPVYGNTVYVEIRKDGAVSASHYITLDYSKDITTTLGNIKDALSGLDAGTYTLTVTAPATVNWQELKQEITFVVDVANTTWTTLPGVSGATQTGSYSYEWKYGATNVSLSAAASNKAPVTYYMDGEQIDALPTDAGSYVITFKVEDTNNYHGISQNVAVTITKASLSSFAEGVSVTGWTWDAFDRVTNRFVAVPDSLGTVKFTVLDANKNVAKVSGNLLDKDGKIVEVVTNKELANITLETVDGRLVVSEAWAKLLNLLTAGTYTLKVDVSETDNYVGFTNERTTFVVSEATNTWTKTPSVAPWSLNAWKEAENMPVAEARYGYYEIFIKADINNEVFYHEYFDEVTGEYVIVNDLNSAPIGWYTMTAIVKKAEGKYNNSLGEDLTGSMRFQIFVKGSPNIANHWVDIPSISGWTANLDGEFNMPVGTPARGRPYFEFYKAVKNADGEYVRGDKVTADDLVITIPNTDKIYAKEWYIPIEPGFYFMAACAEVSGNSDDGLETFLQQPFEISKRTNAFVEEPRIETLLYLGDREKWAEPTALVIDGNDRIVFTYVNKITGEKLGTTKPSKEGTYYLIATVEETTFYKMIESKPVEFTVELSTNEWSTEPIIEDWTEELLENDPEALAKYGGEVTYTYENLATGEILYVKPTTEGSYKMTATVKLAGYKDLVGTTTFTIDPAYDKDLLIVDIILGCVACALAVFVIIFAIRRYREN